MKLTNQQLSALIIRPGLAKLRQTDGLPARFTFPLRLLIKQLTPAVEAYDEARRAIAEKYCLRSDDGKPKFGVGESFLWPSADAMRGVEAEMRELNALEFEIQGERVRADLEALEKLGYRPSVQDLLDLEPLIDFVIPPPTATDKPGGDV